MLVLTRKVGEEIHLSGGVVIRIVEVTRGRVKIGIEAPKTIRISRPPKK